jgi:hypothetical protein
VGGRIAVRFAYEWHDDSGHRFRSCGNENREFDADGLMRGRFASINDLPIAAEARRLHGSLGRRPDDAPSLSAPGLQDRPTTRPGALRAGRSGLPSEPGPALEAEGGNQIAGGNADRRGRSPSATWRSGGTATARVAAACPVAAGRSWSNKNLYHLRKSSGAIALRSAARPRPCRAGVRFRESP